MRRARPNASKVSLPLDIFAKCFSPCRVWHVGGSCRSNQSPVAESCVVISTQTDVLVGNLVTLLKSFKSSFCFTPYSTQIT